MSEPSLAGFDARQRALAYPPGIGQHFWLLSRNRIVHDALRAAGAAAPLLDLGCGPGATVHFLRSRGLDCRGADLATYAPVAPEIAGAIRYGADAFELPAAERQQVRTLLLLDVLEHLAAPGAFVRRCVDAHANLAHVLITLPARQELWSNYDEFYGHQRRYDLAGAAALCRDGGVELLEARYFFHALYPVLAIQRLLSVARGVEFKPVRQRRLHALMARALYLDARCLPRSLPGTSLLAVARVRR